MTDSRWQGLWGKQQANAEEARRLYDSGVTVGQLCYKFNVDSLTILNWLKRVPSPPSTRRKDSDE
jgi:hypothetical protein